MFSWRNIKALLLWADPSCNSGSPTFMHFFTPLRVKCTQWESTRTEEEGAEEEYGWVGVGVGQHCRALHGDLAVMLPWMQSAYTSFRYKTIPIDLKSKSRGEIMKLTTLWSDWSPLPKWTFQIWKDKRPRLLQPQCLVYFWIVYIHIYLKCACLNLYWVHIGPPRLQACVVLSPCWWHKTLYQTQSQRHYWNVDWLIALYLHHFWCFYSCVPPIFLIL